MNNKFALVGIILIAAILSGCVDYTKYTAYVDTDDNSILYTRDDCFIYYNNYSNVVKASYDSHCDKEDFNNYWFEQNKIGNLIPYVRPTLTPYIPPTLKPTPIRTPSPTPTPTSTPKDNTKDAWGFIHYVQDNWIYIEDYEGKVVQRPDESYKLLSGDCDDFATMVAYYLEEVYGYDTELVVIAQEEGLHIVAFVRVPDTYTKKMATECNVNAFPFYTHKDGTKYAPIDWKVCPRWTWATKSGSIKTHEWEYYMGKVV